MSAGGRIGIRPDRLIVTTVPESGVITAGGSANFVITSDYDGVRLPNSMMITRIIITPMNAAKDAVVSTIRGLRFYRKNTRLAWEILYEDMWTAFTTASDEAQIDGTNWPYVNQDEENQIVGTLLVKAGENPAAFIIAIEFY